MNQNQKKILVVSSQKDNTKCALSALKNLNLDDIEVKTSGLEALENILSHHWHLVICDVEMRQIDGWTFVKELKLSDKLPNLPVILMGLSEAPATEEELKSYGVIRYAKMPIKDTDLDFLINSTLTLFKTSGTIENKFTKAKDSLLREDNDEAIELFSELKSLTKNSLRSNVGLAQAYLQNNDSERAAPIIEEIAVSPELSPQKLMMHIRLALKKEAYDQAKLSMESLLSKNPSEFYYARLVKLCLDYGQVDIAEPFAEEAVALGFKQNEFYKCLARCAVRDQNYEQALGHLKSSEDMGDVSSELYNIKGVCYRKIGDLSMAVDCYEEALRLNPTDPKIYFNLALCNIETKDLNQAMQNLNSCLEISPTFSRAKDKLQEIKGKMAS